MALKTYAAIDIGTVTCRLLIAQSDGKRVFPLEKRGAITNLGEGVDATGVLKPEAMERVFRAVADFQRAIATYEDRAARGEACGALEGVASGEAPEDGEALADRKASTSPLRVVALATSAARDAENASVFVDGLAKQGVELSVIPGEKEACLSFLGASADFAGQPIIVTDIGGGSTEVIAGTAGEKPLFAHSFNIGCRRITERFLTCDPLDAAQVADARQWVRAQFEPYFEKLHDANFHAAHVVSVAGTATSIVSMIERMEVYDSARVHGATVNEQQLDQLLCELSHMNLNERMHRVGLQPQRASVICGGLIIQQEVMRAARAQQFVASEADILHGIILTAAREDVVS